MAESIEIRGIAQDYSRSIVFHLQHQFRAVHEATKLVAYRAQTFVDDPGRAANYTNTDIGEDLRKEKIRLEASIDMAKGFLFGLGYDACEAAAFIKEVRESAN